MPEPGPPIRTTSLLGPLMLRRDLTREQATAYWANGHAEIVKRSLPGVVEYVQRHYSPTDHSFWPATGVVGTLIPDEWHLDGNAELRFADLRALLAASLHQREIQLDEQNAFSRVLGHTTLPNGGRWWTAGHDDRVGHRVCLYLRRRRGVRRAAFTKFVYDQFAPALLSAGATDLRAYVFAPFIRTTSTTLGVAHGNPIQHRYHALVILGVEDREAVDALLTTPQVGDVVAAQEQFLTAVHAYGVERSVPVIRGTG